MDINGASAIVTGGASGIGAAVARQLAAQGAKVVVADLNPEKGEALAERDRRRLRPGRRDQDRADRGRDRAGRGARPGAGAGQLRRHRLGAAHGRPRRQFESAADLDAFSKVIAINLIGTFDCIRLVGTAISRNEPTESGERGAIVNMASVAAFDGQIGQAAYSASKGGVVGMTLPVARDLAAVGIRLNTVAPGLIDTPIYGEGEAAEAFKAKLGESVLFPKRLGQSPTSWPAWSSSA